MEGALLTDNEQLPELLHQVRDFTVDLRLDNLRPTGSTLTDIPEAVLPEAGGGAQDAMKVFQKQWFPYLVASPSERYLGYVTGGTTPAALIGDWLTSATDQNPQDLAGFGDVSAGIERAT
ncbi:MAG: aspartate aminotransferase family protein, partial [Bacteroidota bacterium]